MFASMKPLLGRLFLLQFKKYLVKTIIPSATEGPCIQNLYIHTVDSTILAFWDSPVPGDRHGGGIV